MTIGISGADTIFVTIVALSGFIMGALACRDIDVVIDYFKKSEESK
jgi:hypothetical protein